MVHAGHHDRVLIDDIELDRSNPRIRKFLEMYGDDPTPEQIFLALGAGNDDDASTSSSTTYEKLKQSILSNGGIIQPIILNRRQDGTLICVEGNTRVALYRHFRDTKVAGDWTRIPALVHARPRHHMLTKGIGCRPGCKVPICLALSRPAICAPPVLCIPRIYDILTGKP